MKKNHKYSTILLFVLSVMTCFSILALSVKADSGWDSDYGGGYSGGDFDFDFGGDYSGSGGELTPGSFVLLVVIIIIVAIIYSKNKNNVQSSSHKSSITNHYEDSIKIKQLTDLTPVEIQDQVFEIYKNIQIAWTNFDYETMQKYTSDEMFNMYKMQLETLKMKNQKNVMSDFIKRDIAITDIYADNDLVTIKLELVVAQKDYVIDAQNKVIKGTDARRMLMHYELTFTMTKDANNGKCPNCGAPIANQASNICSYCNSTIVSSHHDLIMTKKEKKGQGWE